MDQVHVVSPAYTAARTAAAQAALAGAGWLRITGRTRLDFFQRLSTNDFRRVAPGQPALPGGSARPWGQPTVLTSPTGRVIAALLVYVGPDEVHVRTEAGQAPAVARYLNNLIFWNDDIQVADLSAETAQWGLYGPQAGSGLAGLAGGAPLDGLAPYGWLAAEIAGAAVTLHRGGPLELPAWTVAAPAAAAGEVAAALAGLGPSLEPATLEQLRVEAGLPAWGHELSDQVTPLEAGLTAAISFNKGCYTGQEVIARQVNYDKVTRQLVGLLLPPELAGLAQLPGARVSGGTGRPGFVSSAAWSPALGRPIALAIVPRDAAAPGSQVTLQGEGLQVTASVTGLPFVGVQGG